jgi:hypothetical protein
MPRDATEGANDDVVSDADNATDDAVEDVNVSSATGSIEDADVKCALDLDLH